MKKTHKTKLIISYQAVNSMSQRIPRTSYWDGYSRSWDAWYSNWNKYTYIYKIYHNISNKSLKDEQQRKIEKKLWKLIFWFHGIYLLAVIKFMFKIRENGYSCRYSGNKKIEDFFMMSFSYPLGAFKSTWGIYYPKRDSWYFTFIWLVMPKYLDLKQL